MPARPRTRRTICAKQGETFHYLVDTCFLVNKYLDVRRITDVAQRRRVESSQEWWAIIDGQLHRREARVFLPDIVVAEAFKALARRYYANHWSGKSAYRQARNRLQQDVHLPTTEARKQSRHVSFHDIQLNRDIVISVDRFFELASKRFTSVSIVDLIVAATGKYLVDFYGFSKSDLAIVTTDSDLYKLCRACPELPSAYNPDVKADAAAKVFAIRQALPV
jgi:predicted nucleic acid-binding protein